MGRSSLADVVAANGGGPRLLFTTGSSAVAQDLPEGVPKAALKADGGQEQAHVDTEHSSAAEQGRTFIEVRTHAKQGTDAEGEIGTLRGDAIVQEGRNETHHQQDLQISWQCLR